MSPRMEGVNSGLYVPVIVRGEKVHLLVDTDTPQIRFCRLHSSMKFLLRKGNC